MGSVAYWCECGYNISEEVPKGGDAVAALMALEAQGRANHKCSLGKGDDKET